MKIQPVNVIEEKKVVATMMLDASVQSPSIFFAII